MISLHSSHGPIINYGYIFSNVTTCKRFKECFYIAQYPVHWMLKTFLHFTPRQTCSFRHQLDFSGKHSCHAANTREDYSLAFPPLSIGRYPFIQLGELGRMARTKMPKLRNGSNGRIRTRALSIASLAFYPWATALQMYFFLIVSWYH